MQTLPFQFIYDTMRLLVMQNLLQCYFHLQKSLEDVLMVCKTLKMQSFVGQFCIINLMNLCLYSNTKGGFLSGNKAINRIILG